MFEDDIRITGKHAIHVKYLAKDINIFDRYIDVYMVGSIFGFLYGKKAEKDTSSEDYANILASTVVSERLRLDFLYRLIMLLDETSEHTPEGRINRAFRETATDRDSVSLAENMKLFNSYVLGGIEFLYEEFTDGCETRDACIKKIYNVVTDFYNDLHIESLDIQIHEDMSSDN